MYTACARRPRDVRVIEFTFGRTRTTTSSPFPPPPGSYETSKHDATASRIATRREFTRRPRADDRRWSVPRRALRPVDRGRTQTRTVRVELGHGLVARSVSNKSPKTRSSDSSVDRHDGPTAVTRPIFVQMRRKTYGPFKPQASCDLSAFGCVHVVYRDRRVYAVLLTRRPKVKDKFINICAWNVYCTL